MNLLTSDAKNMIETATWTLGGTSRYDNSSYGLANHWYNYERGCIVYSGRPIIWQGEIGLMFPSDYGYATGGSSTMIRSSCLAKSLYMWNSSGDCFGNDWLYDSSSTQWTISPNTSLNRNAFFVSSSGKVDRNDTKTTYLVRPVVYLKSNVQIIKGNGAKSTPYELEIDIND